ncbi:MAG: hypothetical protein Ct9H300mP9_4050 [Candidatus Neomarinimicrobiota bacterium]|nr:MAG: hypothetical protein Ct9H300mP9_4050 [Candidatus Neomarinimicrobiota bacterium]
MVVGWNGYGLLIQLTESIIILQVLMKQVRTILFFYLILFLVVPLKGSDVLIHGFLGWGRKRSVVHITGVGSMI